MCSKVFAMASVIVLSSFLAVEVMADCHNDDEWGCENLERHLISHDRWDTVGNRVRFYVNNEHFSDPPNLFPDVNYAASAWSDIEFKGIVVSFVLQQKGETQQTPFNQDDGVNTVGWGHHDDGVLGEVFRVYDPQNGRRLIEADMLLNYYEPFSTHDEYDQTTYCLRAVITHEFGHFVRLLDVQDGNPPDDDCVHYEHFTMFEEAYKGNKAHLKEQLACEDKYGTWWTYHRMPWAAPIAISFEEPPPALEGLDIVLQTRLLQNYPDPFNPETWIPYELADRANVTIGIYDTNGGLVRLFKLGVQQRGKYTSKQKALYWDGTNNFGEKVNSGVYFYRLLAGGVSETRKLVVLK